MNPIWAGIILLAGMNVLFKAVGPVLLSGKNLPGRLEVLIDAVGQCLLVSLVVVAILGARGASLDPAIVGGALTAVAFRCARKHELICVLAGLLVTIAVRLW